MAEGSILTDPRYWDFVERFQSDPLGFAVLVCGMLPSNDQEELLISMTQEDAKVSVVSGTGTGKTASFGRIALWHLLCFPMAVYEDKLEIGSNTYIAASRIKQVSDGVWKEMNDCYLAISDSEFAWVNQYYKIDSEKVSVKGFEKTWFIQAVAMQQGKSIGIAGKHRYWQLIIIDEAAGVSDDHFDVIEGTQTQPGNRTLMASQGVKNSGRFYESHHNRALSNGGSWKSLRFNSERSPFVTLKWIKERDEETGGRDTIEYQIRVLGIFAENSGDNLLTRSELEKAFLPRKIIQDDEPYGLFVLADVGMGEYRDDSVAVVAKVIGIGDFDIDARRVEYIEIPLCTNAKNEIVFAGDLVNLVGKLSNATLLVDNGGVGATVSKLIEASGVPVVKINWGKPCFKKEYQERFYNRRACAMVRFRDAIKSGRAVLPQGLSRKLKEKILLQGARLPYNFAEAGGLRYIMEKKEIMKKEGIDSPDIIDAMSFAWLEDANDYMVADVNSLNNNSFSSTVKKAAEDMFADVN